MFWSFLRSVLVLKILGFSVLVSTAVSGFACFFLVFINKKVVFRFLLFSCLIPRPHRFHLGGFSVLSDFYSGFSVLMEILAGFPFSDIPQCLVLLKILCWISNGR